MATFLLLLEGRAARPSAPDEQTAAYNRKWLAWIGSLVKAGSLDEVTAIARQAPHTELGGKTIIRPCDEQATT